MSLIPRNPFHASQGFLTGAIPTPRHVLCAATPHVVLSDTPSVTTWIPEKLDLWGNGQYGDCVSAEEAYAKGCRSPSGWPGVFISAQVVIDWARGHGFLNGANLTEVMDAMRSDGFHMGGQVEGDGPHTSVDYSNESVLRNAISIGPVKIAIDSSFLPKGAGSAQGWYSLGGTPNHDPNLDHCVSLGGYGPAHDLYSALNVAVPSAISPTQLGYLLFTWATLGFVDHAWIMSTCGEAWLRNPTNTGGNTPPPPPPPPPPSGKAFSMHISRDLVAGKMYGWRPSTNVKAGNYDAYPGAGGDVVELISLG